MSSRSLLRGCSIQEIDGVNAASPSSALVVDVPADCVGPVIEKLGQPQGGHAGDDSRGQTG